MSSGDKCTKSILSLSFLAGDPISTLVTQAHTSAFMTLGRAGPLGVEIDAVVVRVLSHVVPVHMGCHRQWRRHLHARSLVLDTEYYIPVSSHVCSSSGQTSMSRSPSPLQRTQKRKRGASRSPRFAPGVRTVCRTRIATARINKLNRGRLRHDLSRPVLY